MAESDSLDNKHGTSDEYTNPCFEGKGLNIKGHGYCKDCLDDKHGASDQYNDPFCDPCFEGKGLNIKVDSYCKDCFQFLCLECHLIHLQLQVSRSHVILQGASMPQSQADKPPKFEYCDRHPTLLKEKFCYTHKTLICSSCASDHRKCVTGTVAEVCKTVNSYETNLLYDTVKALHDQAKSIVMSIQANIKNLREQKKQMLKEAQELHDKVISKVNKLLLDMQSEIEAACHSQERRLSQQQDRTDDIVSRFESLLRKIEKFRRKSVDTKLFLKIQESVTDTNQITDEFRSLNESLLLADLALDPSKTIEEFLSATFTLGSVSKSDTKPGTNTVVTEILSPGSVPMKAIKEAVKEGTYEVKVKEDKNKCFIGGLAVAKDGRKLVSDIDNDKVKMFSHDMKFLSSVSVPGWPRDVAVISETEAVVTTDQNTLVILDISGSQLSIETTTKLSYDVHGISRYNDKLVVTSPYSNPPSVKVIDKTGRVYWSVSSDQHGWSLFIQPWYVCSPGEGRSSTVIVTDWVNDMLTLLNGETGEVIARRQLKEGKDPRGVTTDSHGNVYVCYRGTDELALLSGDLLVEKILLSGSLIQILLSRQGSLSSHPQAIVYDCITHQLILSYYDQGTVDIFKLL